MIDTSTVLVGVYKLVQLTSILGELQGIMGNMPEIMVNFMELIRIMGNLWGLQRIMGNFFGIIEYSKILVTHTASGIGLQNAACRC